MRRFDGEYYYEGSDGFSRYGLQAAILRCGTDGRRAWRIEAKEQIQRVEIDLQETHSDSGRFVGRWVSHGETGSDDGTFDAEMYVGPENRLVLVGHYSMKSAGGASFEPWIIHLWPIDDD